MKGGKILAEIGSELKKAREDNGLTLEEIQEATKIRKKYLKAIENENYEVIPGKTYVKAFIKKYAAEVGLNGKEIVKKYENEIQIKQKNEKEQKQKINKETKFWKTKWTKIIIILIIIFSIITIIYTISVNQLENSSSVTLSNSVNNQKTQDQNKERDTLSKQNTLTIPTNNNNINNNNKSKTNTKTDTLQIHNDKKKMVKLIASEKSWLQIYIDEKKIFQGFMYKGDIKKISGKKTAAITIGNGIAIRIIKNGEAIGPWGKRGEVIKKKINF